MLIRSASSLFLLTTALLSGCAHGPNRLEAAFADPLPTAAPHAQAHTSTLAPIAPKTAPRTAVQAAATDPNTPYRQQHRQHWQLASSTFFSPSAAIPGPLLPNNLWDRIRQQLSLPRKHANIRRHIRWFERHPGYLYRVAERARPVLYDIVRAVEERGMPVEIALLPVVESAYQPFAYSHAKAAGPWQFISSTGRHYGLQQNWWQDERRDFTSSTRAALDYLQNLHDEFHDWSLALAAYNTGENNVRKAIKRNRRHGRRTDFWSLRLPRETRNYVPKLLAIAEIIAHPGRYRTHIPYIPDRPYLTQVTLDHDINLMIAAQASGLDSETFFALNPAFNRGWSEPNQPVHLLLPKERKQAFMQRMALVMPIPNYSWKAHYTVHKRDSLYKLSKRFHVSSRAIQAYNDMGKRRTLHAGETLYIPDETLLSTPAGFSEAQLKTVALLDKHHNEHRAHTYRVKRGDTLWSIAKHFRTSIRSLVRWNKLHRNQPLRIGQKIVIRKRA